MNWMNTDYFIPEWLAPQETRGREEFGGKGEKGGESPFTHKYKALAYPTDVKDYLSGVYL